MPFVRGPFPRKRYSVLQSTEMVVKAVPRTDWAPVATVWVTPLSLSQMRDSAMTRYEYPVTHIVRIDPCSFVVAGARMADGPHMFDVLGLDDTHTTWVVHLRELPR